jgi:hypothetical protein
MTEPETDPAAVPAATDDRLREMLEQLLLVLARLLVARGIGFPEMEQMLARAYVDAALRWHVGSERPTASRLYMLTGIHRKKIPPLLRTRSRRPVAPSLSQQIGDYLSSDTRRLDRTGRIKPMAITRKEGGELSFEAAVEAVSKDIRSRAVLDQWLANGMASLDARGRVRVDLMSEVSSYAGDAKAELLDRIVRPTLSAAVASLLNTRERSSTMAVFVDELHPEDAEALQLQWRDLLRAEVLRFNSHAERHAADAHRAGRRGECTLFVGAFEWVDGAPPPSTEDPDAGPPASQTPVRKRRAPRRRAVK